MTSAGNGRRGALVPAAAAVGLAIVGAVTLLGPDVGAPSPPGDGQAGTSLAQLAAPTPAPPPPSPAPATDPPSTARVPSDASAAGEEAAGEHEPTYPTGQEPWRPVVTGFATDFAQPAPDWSTRVIRWTSDYLTEQYRALPLERVPAATLQDVEVVATGEAVVDVIATYDTELRLIIRVEKSAEGWKVAKVESAE